MIRKRFRKSPTSISLFPFLAVLICTMGAMILLLVMGVQQAHVHAEVMSEEKNNVSEERMQQLAAMRQEAEDARWKWEMLQPSRDEKLKELADQEAVMSHLESEIRELEKKWNRIAAQIKSLEDQQDELGGDSATLAAQLATARAQREQLAMQVEEAKARLAQQKRSYRIIPYDGPNGTQRRPIYIECTADGIVFQPENVVVTERDFLGPAGPGNPLATALRAKREYLIRNGLVNDVARPYPLLVVRPGGSKYYALARRAMSNWEDEYGYELVEDDVKLDYTRPDPALSRIIEHAIATARQRQSLLAAAQPRLYQQLQRMMQQSRFEEARRGSPGTSVPVSQRQGRRQPPVSSQPPPKAETVNNPYVNKDDAQTQGTGAGRAALHPNAQSSGAGGEPGAKDWALKGEEGTRIPRYARVSCEPNRLVLLPNRLEKQRPRVVPINGSIDIRKFVDELWSFVESWGMAYPGATWKPILLVDVAPNGETRFQELQRLLDGSGIEVKRKDR